MWLVDKGAKTANGGERVDPALAATLRIWYQGQGDHTDEKHALVLFRHARRHRQWLACDCRDSIAAPMLSPALLSEADTYYLRRLTGRERTEHVVACPFFRAQQLAATTTSDGPPTSNIPDGFFAVLKRAPTALAQAPATATARRDGASHGTPRLAKLLWRLLEASGCTTIPATEMGERTIAVEFAAIRRVAEQIEVAPGIQLARVLFTHPRDWQSRRAFAVLRELAARWPKGHEPQAFLLVYAKGIHEQSIETSDGPIEIATRVRHPGTRDAPTGGSKLALVAIGRHPDVGGYSAQRDWAQPVHNGHRFIPIEDNFDRHVIEALLTARRVLWADKITVTAYKPLFDQLTPQGPVRPRWIVTLEREHCALRAVLTSTWDEHDERTRRALGFLAEPIAIDGQSVEQLTIKLRQSWQASATA